eukprot:4288813-Heterocapsa_arctica.AAC.1
MHALNNATGRPLHTKADMEFACKTFLWESRREQLYDDVAQHAAAGGWYSSEVLVFAVRSTSLRHAGRV